MADGMPSKRIPSLCSGKAVLWAGVRDAGCCCWQDPPWHMEFTDLSALQGKSDRGEKKKKSRLEPACSSSPSTNRSGDLGKSSQFPQASALLSTIWDPDTHYFSHKVLNGFTFRESNCSQDEGKEPCFYPGTFSCLKNETGRRYTRKSSLSQHSPTAGKPPPRPPGMNDQLRKCLIGTFLVVQQLRICLPGLSLWSSGCRGHGFNPWLGN